MSNTIDTRVVEMKFDNAAFERGVASTLKSLAGLEKGLQLKGAANGLNEVSKAASRFSIGNIASNVESIASRFSALGVVGVTALASIAHQALATGATLLKSLTTDPLKAGLAEYETNLGSIQTILSNTGLEGKKGLQTVTGALDELNHYSDQTIYNFSEMAKNIGTFTAAGIELKPATAAIKGIANLAAVSGSNAEQASSAMYQLSQAMAAGKATLVDWNSVVNAGMGGKVFQEALKETARVQGVNVDAIIKKNGSFRDSLSEGWLTTKVLTETLSKFTGDLTADQLKSMGYTQDQIAGIMKMGKTAQDAATKVKTVSQLINTLQEAAGSGWAKTWQLVFGDFDEAKTLFTNVNTVLGGMIQKSADARNKVLGDWKKLGGRTVLIEGIGLAFNNVMEILTPFGKAFRDVFPAATGKSLFDLTVKFRDLMSNLRLGEDTMTNLRKTFAGFFAIFSIGFSILKGLGTVIATVFKNLSGGSGGILEFTGNIGDWLVALDKAIKKGEGFKQFFRTVGDVISVPLKFLQKFASLLADATGVISQFVSNGAGDLTKNFNPLETLGDKISKAWSGVSGLLGKVMTVFTPLAQKFQEFFQNFGNTVSNSTAGVDWNGILASINTGLFGGLVLLFRNFLANGLKLNLGEGISKALSSSLQSLSGVLSGMQQNLKANALMKLAIAIGLLAVSVKVLSTIDPKQLGFATAALATMFGQLIGAMKLLEVVSSSTGFIKMPFIAASLILLSIAINLLALAVAQLAKLNWQELAKGLTGVAVLLTSLALFTRFAQVSKGSVGSSASLILLAVAIKMLVDSVQGLAGMSWGEMAQGLTGVAALLTALALFTKFSAANKGGVAQGAGLVLTAFAIKILAGAIKDIGQLSWQEIAKGMSVMAVGLGLIGTALTLIPASSLLSAAAIVLVALSFTKIALAVLIVVKALDQLTTVIKNMGQMSWTEIAKGLTVMAVSIGLIGAALYLLPKTAIFSAAAIYIVAQALVVIAKALGTMGGMSWVEIAKSLIVLAGSLAIIAAALYLMTAALPGALALIVVAASLKLLAPVLVVFGAMSWDAIAKGLTMLAGVFLVLGVAGLAIGPVVPALIGLGLAIAILGVGMLAAGAGVLMFSIGLAGLAVSGAAAAGALVAALHTILGALPGLAAQFGLAIIAFATAIAKAGPAIIAAMVTILTSLLNAINKMSPKIITTLGNLLVLLLNAAVRYVPKMVDAGLKLITGILNGIANNIGKMITAATNVIVNFLNGLAKNIPRVIQAGVDLILAYINGIANAIRDNGKAVGEAGANLGTAIVEGMLRGMAGGIGKIASSAANMAQSALDAAKRKLGIKSPSREFKKIGAFVVAGFVQGLDGNKGQIDSAFNSLKKQLLDFQKAQVNQVNTLEAKLKKLRSARKKDNAEINRTVAAIALARAEWRKANAVYTSMNKGLAAQHGMLGALATRYDQYTAKIKNAQDALTEAIKVRDDYNKSVREQFSDLATPADDQSLAEFIAAGKKQIEDEKIFTAVLTKLRSLGLNDEMFKDLVAKGTSALPFMQELLSSGKSGVAEVNAIDKQLDLVGANLGKTASTQLYQAGVNAAQGLVNGLKAQQAAIEKQMDIIATAMVKSIKRQLGIKSPSRVFAEIGKHTVQGMAVGLDRYSKLVSDSAKNVGDDAINTLRKSISSISDVVTTDANFNPVIRPVLDLSDVEKNASRVGSLLTAKPIKVDASLAERVAVGVSGNQDTQQRQTEIVRAPAALNFTQINNSPKALTSATIYRQTKNQLSVAKGALPK